MKTLLSLNSTPVNYSLTDLKNIEYAFYKSYSALNPTDKYTTLYGNLFGEKSFSTALANEFVFIDLKHLSNLTSTKKAKKLYHTLRRDLQRISSI